MKAKELRIGNYVHGQVYDENDEINNFICEVCSLDSIGVTDHRIWVEVVNDSNVERFENIFPIQITEDWLIKLGFEKIKGYTYPVFRKKMDKISFLFELKDGELLFNSESKSVIGFKYIHQLQNIIFVLTREELKL